MKLAFSQCLILISILVNKLNAESFYSFSTEDGNGEEVSLKNFEGKVTLVVNVASKCGYTDATYRALARLHDILSYSGHFSVLAFPCNQFGEQEPDEIGEIVNYVRSEYGVEFPIFNKIDVVGPNANPAFQNLIEQSSLAPEWNFYKYLVDETGSVLGAWGTRVTIEEIFEDIQDAVTAAENKTKQSLKDDSQDTSEQNINKDEL